jgi:hypothetical protein
MGAAAARATGIRLIRPLAQAADGIVHNRERRRTIRRYRRVTCVALADSDAKCVRGRLAG